MSDDLDDFIDELLVDAYGDHDQLTAFEQAFHDLARFPIKARIVGAPVDIIRVEFDGVERRGLTAVCRRDGEDYRVALADFVPGPLTVETARLFAAYRRWLGLPSPEPVAGAPPGAPTPWAYVPVAANPAVLQQPLKLNPMGTWDPAEQYWGEEGEEADRDPVYLRMIAAGPRPAFEMEQVIPGVGEDDWDVDPVADAAELHGAGYDREASQILRDLLAQDIRCIDAWVHLGNIAFRSTGPKAALDLYDTAVAIAEQCLPDGFSGVLPRGLIDNRPFHRALHGLGLCAWRQRRWTDAAVIFTNLAWIDGGQTSDAIECLRAVEAHERWRQHDPAPGSASAGWRGGRDG
jgi:hypothetical protein